MEYDFSVGMLPYGTQDILSKIFDIPKNQNDAIQLALKQDSQAMDLIVCNDTIL
jgi:diacylglycerol kinase family enzyme